MENIAALTSAANPTTAAGVGLASTIAGNIIGEARARAQRKWVEEQTEKQREWDLMMWNKTNEYNDPANAVARMQKAGLNPLNFDVNGNAVANNISAASPVGMPSQAPTIGLGNPMETYTETKLANKQMELINSQIDKNKAETRGTELDSDFKEKTFNTREEALRLSNNMSEERIKEINAHRDEMLEHVEKMKQEKLTEIEKQGLIRAQTWLRKAEARQIEQLLPYQKLLMEAQTNAQKAAAAASFANAAYQNGLIDGGYINAMIDQAKANAKNTEQIAAINQFKQSVMNGTLYDEKNGSFIDRGGAWFMNGLVSTISTLSQAIGGGLSGIVSTAMGK